MEKDPNHPRAQDPRSTEELIAAALATADDDERWECVRTLRYRGSQLEFDAAAQLCASPNAKERALGVDMLAQLGYSGEYVFRAEAVPLLIERLGDEDEDVIETAAVALGHRRDPQAIPHLCKLMAPPNEEVRYGVTFGLLNFDTPEAINAKFQLSQDNDAEIRDWATFGLGTQIDTDTPEIRAALLARCEDEDEDTRGEACVGLAKRQDERVLPYLEKELEMAFALENYGSLLLEAIEFMPNPRLSKGLQQLRQLLDNETEAAQINELDQLLAACLAATSSK